MRKELFFKTAEGVELYGIFNHNEELINFASEDISSVITALKKDLKNSDMLIAFSSSFLLFLIAFGPSRVEEFIQREKCKIDLLDAIIEGDPNINSAYIDRDNNIITSFIH